MMGKASQSGQEKDGEKQEGSRYGPGQFSSNPPRGKPGNWHSATQHQTTVLFRN
jgi:hypothetical protein